MTSRGGDAHRRWLGLVLAALTAVLVTLLGGGNPSAGAATGGQARLGAHAPECPVALRTHDGIDAGEGVEISPPPDDSSLAAGVVAVSPVTATPRLAPEYNYDGATRVYDARVRCVDAAIVDEVEAVGRDAPEVSIRRLSSSKANKSVAVSGFVVAAKGAALTARSRADQLQAALPAGSRGRVTMGVGVGRDSKGAMRTVVGTSEPNGYLRPGVSLNPGEELATGAGHAERSILDYMLGNGIEPMTIGAGRPICAACATLLDQYGIWPASPLKVP